MKTAGGGVGGGGRRTTEGGRRDLSEVELRGWDSSRRVEERRRMERSMKVTMKMRRRRRRREVILPCKREGRSWRKLNEEADQAEAPSSRGLDDRPTLSFPFQPQPSQETENKTSYPPRARASYSLRPRVIRTAKRGS